MENNSCQGKCHLKKQLDASDEEEKSRLPQSLKEKADVNYCQAQQEYIFYSGIEYSKRSVSFYHSDFYPSSTTKDIFHPPQINLI